MMNHRVADQRGKANFGWLDSNHSFSFGSYYHPQHMGFRRLRVINEDRITPSSGFDTHSHRDMEIISYVISGALKHKDSVGNVAVIPPGDIQRMSAGTGISHSEYNHSDEQVTHFLQIWIEPNQYGITPGYEQKSFADRLQPGELLLIGSENGRDESIVIHQDVNLYVARLNPNQSIEHLYDQNRHIWVQVIHGDLTINGKRIQAGDGLAISEENKLQILAEKNSEILIFDLA